MNNRLNKYKCLGAKRLMLEAQELRDNTEDYCAQPLEDNLFEWHFTIRGPPDSAFEGGFYHGRLSFPTEYPLKPPSIIVFTPNGRFETNKKICLSISGYHPETWQPSWSVRTALLALIAFMPTKANRAVGSLNFPDEERRQLALKSRSWHCDSCGSIKNLLRPAANHCSGHDLSGLDRLCANSIEKREIVQDSRDCSNSEAWEDARAYIEVADNTRPHISLRDNSSSSRKDNSSDTQSSSQLRIRGSPSIPERSQLARGLEVTVETPQRLRSTLVIRSIVVLLFLLIVRKIAIVFLLH